MQERMFLYILHRVARTWLPLSIREAASVNSFKALAKSFLWINGLVYS